MNRFTWSLKGRIRWFPVRLKDTQINRQWKSSGERFLVVRHAARQPYFYRQFLEFVAGNYPELRRLFELRLLPCRLHDPSKYVLQIPWIQDPLEDWSPRGYRQAWRLQRDCVRHGVPIVNRVDCHKNASKLEGARRIALAGFRTPRMAPIADVLLWVTEAFSTRFCPRGVFSKQWLGAGGGGAGGLHAACPQLPPGCSAHEFSEIRQS